MHSSAHLQIMAGLARTRTKRVTDPLDEKIKGQIVGGDSSGSEHGGDSPSLSDLVHDYLLDGAGEEIESPEYESEPERDSSQYDQIDELVNPAMVMKFDSFRNLLLANVYQAMEMLSGARADKSAIRRSVMAFLRENGLNAAICKTKWESSGGLTAAGSYEFIDVVMSDPATSSQLQRYFIDLDFPGEFEIARPTNQYERILQNLPMVFVGRGEELKQIAKAMSDSARRSLKSRGLSLPPWRRNRFMQNKWFGPYRRTTNLIPANSPSFPTPAKPSSSPMCRTVGFDAVNGGFAYAATTRTR